LQSRWLFCAVQALFELRCVTAEELARKVNVVLRDLRGRTPGARLQPALIDTRRGRVGDLRVPLIVKRPDVEHLPLAETLRVEDFAR